MINLKTKKAIEIMEIAGRITKQTLDEVEKHIRPGISTLELDEIAENYIRSQNAIPSFKNYEGFPGTICASVNDVIVHGIPSKNIILKEGDIITIDTGANYRGYHGDAARTFPVGKISSEKQKLIDVAKECFFEGLKQVKVGNTIGDIGYAIQQHAEKHGYSIIRELCGHGIGKDVHEDPNVPNYGYKGFGEVIKDGLVIAIEPMIAMGHRDIKIDKDGWTCRTRDKKCSAHYENTVAIIDGEIKILTL